MPRSSAIDGVMAGLGASCGNRGGWRVIALPLLAILLDPAISVAAPTPSAKAAETTDAPVDTSAETLLAREIELIRKGRLAEAERSLSRKMVAQRSPRERADLIGAFATQLFLNAPKLDDPTSAKILDYLDRAIDAYRVVLGIDHPDVATALTRRAEVERLLHPADPAPWADAAYQQAYRIRFKHFGGSSLVTLSTLIPMAELKALPSRANGNPAEIEAAAGLLRRVIEEAALSRDEGADALRAEALEALKRLDGAYGDGQPGAPRPQVMTAGATQQCATLDLRDAILFSGEPGPLQLLRDRFAKAKLALRPCGSMLVFPLSPGVDPTPVLDLLTDISTGRMKGVRMGLGDDGGIPPTQPTDTPSEER